MVIYIYCSFLLVTTVADTCQKPTSESESSESMRNGECMKCTNVYIGLVTMHVIIPCNIIVISAHI